MNFHFLLSCIPDSQRSNILYVVHGSVGELRRGPDEHDSARADHPAHRLHLHPLRHLVHRHVPKYLGLGWCWVIIFSYFTFFKLFITIIAIIMISSSSSLSPDPHPQHFSGLVKSCVGCHWNQNLTNLKKKNGFENDLNYLNAGLPSFVPVSLASKNNWLRASSCDAPVLSHVTLCNCNIVKLWHYPAHLYDILQI